MNSKEFVAALKVLRPSDEQFRSIGLSDKEIIEFNKLWNCKPKSKASKYDDPILDLVNNYDCSKSEMSGLDFYKSTKEIGSYIYFAEYDMDPLAIDRKTSQIVMFRGEDMKLTDYCALNSELFLMCLLKVAEFNTQGLFFDERSTEEITQRALEITQISGLEESKSFYLYILGG